jgi:predicted MFS family arabinose efflux permease
LSWLVLELTGSSFQVGVVLAARMVPLLLLGLAAGVLTDWLDRRKLLVGVNLVNAAVALALVGTAASGTLTFPVLLAAALVLGALDALRITTTQTYAYGLARAAQATRGLALTNFGVQLFGVVGGTLGGFALDRGGAGASFGLVALATLVAAASLLPGRPTLAPPRALLARPRPDLRRAAGLLRHSRLIVTLSLAILLTEVLGFSNQTLLPSFVRDVFEAGAGGLGTLLAARSAGGVVSLLVLARLGTGQRTGLVLLSAIAGMGLALAGFALTPRFELAVVAIMLVGGLASTVDTLGQMLLQRSCPESERGAAMGIWVFSIGFAPLGHLTIGAAASVVGAVATQLACGASLVLVALLLCRQQPLRTLR